MSSLSDPLILSLKAAAVPASAPSLRAPSYFSLSLFPDLIDRVRSETLATAPA